MGFFDGLGAGLVGGVAGLIGGERTNSANAAAAREATAANLASSREQMAFQERMSNSSYQRAMDDMEYVSGLFRNWDRAVQGKNDNI